MPQWSMRINNGIVHGMSSDAVFRDEAGKPVIMSFHTYLGPTFENKDGEDLPEVSPFVWEQWRGWWNAKGRHRYAPGTPPQEPYTEEPEDEDFEIEVIRTGANGKRQILIREDF